MAIEKITIKADAKELLDSLDKARKKRDDLGKGVKVAGGSGGSGGGGVMGMLGGVGKAAGALAGVAAAAVGVAAVFDQLSQMGEEMRNIRDQNADKMDDWSDKGNALGMAGNQGVANAMALDDVLIKAGASPQLVDKMINAWSNNFNQLTDSDKSQLGIENMNGAEAMASIISRWQSFTPDMQEQIAPIVGMDSKRMGIAMAALRTGASDTMLQDLQNQALKYEANINPDTLDKVGLRESAKREGEKWQAIYATQNAGMLEQDGNIMRDRAAREGKYASGQQNILSYQWSKQAGDRWDNVSQATSAQFSKGYDQSTVAKETLKIQERNAKALEKIANQSSGSATPTAQ